MPNHSILYCSESCRRKDQTKPAPIRTPSFSSFSNGYSLYSTTPPLTPYGHGRDIPEQPPSRNYVEPFSPTPPSASVLHDYPSRGRLGSLDNGSSEFLVPGSPMDMISTTPPSANAANIYLPARRPHHNRRGTSGSSAAMSSAGIGIPAPTQYQLSHHHHQRPLPPLRKPSQPSGSPRSIDLVTPYLPVADSPPAHSDILPVERRHSSGEAVHERKSSLSHYHQYPPLSAAATSSSSSMSGNLKTLFNFDAIRSHPTAASTGYSPQPRHHQHTSSADPYRFSAHRPITLK